MTYLSVTHTLPHAHFLAYIQIHTLMANIQFTSRRGSWRPRQCKAAVMRALLVTGSPIKEPRKLSTTMLNNKNTSCCAAPSEFSSAVPVCGLCE